MRVSNFIWHLLFKWLRLFKIKRNAIIESSLSFPINKLAAQIHFRHETISLKLTIWELTILYISSPPHLFVKDHFPNTSINSPLLPTSNSLLATVNRWSTNSFCQKLIAPISRFRHITSDIAQLFIDFIIYSNHPSKYFKIPNRPVFLSIVQWGPFSAKFNNTQALFQTVSNFDHFQFQWIKYSNFGTKRIVLLQPDLHFGRQVRSDPTKEYWRAVTKSMQFSPWQ